MKKTKTQERPAQRFDCRVGDIVLSGVLPNQRRGEIVEVALLNSANYPLDVKVLWENGAMTQISGVGGDVGAVVYVFLDPDLKVTRKFQRWLDQNELLLVRLPASSRWRYRLVRRCDLQPVEFVRSEETSSDLRFELDPDDQSVTCFEGKPCIDDGHSYLRVGQARLDPYDLEQLVEWHTYL